MGWRDHLPVHPAADRFPLMSESELQELGEDIKGNGLQSPKAVYMGKLLDGRNRLDAMELVGIKLESVDDLNAALDGGIWEMDGFYGDPYDYVVSTNLHRRHLTGEQKRELIAKVLKAKPGESNRKIAQQVKADHKTVAAVRNDMESTGEIPQLEKTTGADGKQRKSRAKKEVHRGRWPSDLNAATAGDACLVAELEAEVRAAGSAEVSIEERKAEHAHLDDSTRRERDDSWLEESRRHRVAGREELESLDNSDEDEEEAADPAGLVVAITQNAADKASIAARNLEHDFTDDDRAKIVKAIDALFRKWNSVHRSVADPATVEDNALYTLGRISEHARVCKKIFKLSTIDREAESRISAAIDRMIQEWRSTQATLINERRRARAAEAVRRPPVRQN